jgi:transposase-like protein
MLCPFCQKRGGDQVSAGEPLAHWRCRHCHEEYPVYQGYPVHPAAVTAARQGAVRCPACGSLKCEQVTEAPDMGQSRVFRCPDCALLFPAMIVNRETRLGDDTSFVPKGTSETYLAVHPQAMIDTVAGVERLPTFFALTHRLREYIEHTGFTVVHTEDKTDNDTQVREYTFYFVPDEWVSGQPERARAVQAAITFSWHAGLAQLAGTSTGDVTAPVPLAIGLSVMINPERINRTMQAYLSIVAGLTEVLQTMEMDEVSAIEAEIVVAPGTQEAAIRRLSTVRRFNLDLASPDQWTALIMEMPRQKRLLMKVWELVATSGTNNGMIH